MIAGRKIVILSWRSQLRSESDERKQKGQDRSGDPYYSMVDYPTPGWILQNP